MFSRDQNVNINRFSHQIIIEVIIIRVSTKLQQKPQHKYIRSSLKDLITSMSIPDSILRKAIDAVYAKYDRDHSNTLDKRQLVNCFNELLRMSGSKMQVNSMIMGQILKRMDQDGDGVISKPEFMNMFRLFEGKASSSFSGGDHGNNGNDHQVKSNQGFSNQQPQQWGGNNGNNGNNNMNNGGGNWQSGYGYQGGNNQQGGGFNQGGYGY